MIGSNIALAERLEALKAVVGANPIPTDFDEYWARGLAQMEALGTGCELVPAAFQAPGVACFELYFTGVGGSRIHARFLRPEKPVGRIPAVLVFHGYSGACGSFADFKLGYAAAGFAVAALDTRGQGGMSDDMTPVRGTTFQGHMVKGLSDPDPDKLMFRSNFLDAAQLARIVMAMDIVDPTRVGALGGSQGGGLALACAALTPDLNRAAAMYPFLCDYQTALAKGAYGELRGYLRVCDPRGEREAEILTKLGYVDNQHLARRIRCRVLMMTGLQDDVCPPETQFAAYNNIQSEKDCIVYPYYMHEVPVGWEETLLSFMLEM